MIGDIFEVMQKKDKKVHSKHAVYESVPFGILLAIVGGFLDAYTFIGRGGVFANAQTGNIVLLGIYASKGEWSKALSSVLPILAFVLGVLVSEWIKKNASRLKRLDFARAVLIFESIVLFIIGFVPLTAPNIFVTVTISFIASLQVSSFRKLVDSPYSTTMCTGNLRTASHEAYIAFTQKDTDSALRSIRFFVIILSFLFGAIFGGLLTLSLGVKAIWAAMLVLICAVLLFTIANKKQV